MMRNALVILMAMTISGFLAGCGQNASTMRPEDAQKVVDHLTYFKDARTNLCYAVVASRADFEVSQNGFTITYVPCNPQVEALVRCNGVDDSVCLSKGE